MYPNPDVLRPFVTSTLFGIICGIRRSTLSPFRSRKFFRIFILNYLTSTSRSFMYLVLSCRKVTSMVFNLGRRIIDVKSLSVVLLIRFYTT